MNNFTFPDNLHLHTRPATSDTRYKQTAMQFTLLSFPPDASICLSGDHFKPHTYQMQGNNSVVFIFNYELSYTKLRSEKKYQLPFRTFFRRACIFRVNKKKKKSFVLLFFAFSLTLGKHLCLPSYAKKCRADHLWQQIRTSSCSYREWPCTMNAFLLIEFPFLNLLCIFDRLVLPSMLLFTHT